MTRQTAGPVDTARIRRIEGSFSWIDHRLVTQGWVDVLSRDEILLYLWWTTVGGKNGVSVYSDEKPARRLKLAVGGIRLARRGLVGKGLIAYENGVVQVLPLPSRSS